MFLFAFTDAILKHKPDGILINGNNSQLYDHKRKIEVNYTTQLIVNYFCFVIVY